jgi:hypothetical protein
MQQRIAAINWRAINYFSAIYERHQHCPQGVKRKHRCRLANYSAPALDQWQTSQRISPLCERVPPTQSVLEKQKGIEATLRRDSQTKCFLAYPMIYGLMHYACPWIYHACIIYVRPSPQLCVALTLWLS